MEQQQMARVMLARRAGIQLLRGLNDLARNLPHPDGRTLRVTVDIIDQTGSIVEQLGTADIDVTNASDLGFLASRRNTTIRPAPAPAPAPSGKANLRLVGGA